MCWFSIFFEVYGICFVIRDNESYCSNFQLLYVIPGGQYNILPNKLRQYINEKNTNFFQKYEFVWAFCRYFWESHVRLPVVNHEQLCNMNKELLVL